MANATSTAVFPSLSWMNKMAPPTSNVAQASVNTFPARSVRASSSSAPAQGAQKSYAEADASELIDEERDDIAAAKTPATMSPLIPGRSSSTINRAKISSVVSKALPS